RHSGAREGDISIVLVPDGWWWVIPLKNDRTSVGLVAPAKARGDSKLDESYFFERIGASSYLRERLANARRVAPIRTLSDWSYSSERMVGERWLLVGDAATFIDSVFSTGVYLGMAGAFRAAETVERALARGHCSRTALLPYERWVKEGVEVYRKFVRGFYRPEFVEVLLHPSDWMGLRAAVTSLLAGHGLDRTDVRLRATLFHVIERANRHLTLVPRLSGRRVASG